MMRGVDGEPIGPGDVLPHGRCQPPVAVFDLIDQLDAIELRRLARVTAIWAPEVFELGLERVSEMRAGRRMGGQPERDKHPGRAA